MLPPFITTHLSQTFHHCCCCLISCFMPFFKWFAPKKTQVLQLEPHSPSLYSKVQGTTLPFKHPSKGFGLATHSLLKMDEQNISDRFRNTICKFPLIIISIIRFPVLHFASHMVKKVTTHLYTSRQHRVPSDPGASCAQSQAIMKRFPLLIVQYYWERKGSDQPLLLPAKLTHFSSPFANRK